jgi:hypothetical protein
MGGNLEPWVEPGRLPCPRFALYEATRMPVDLLDEMTTWVLKGERGHLTEAQEFRWKGQSTAEHFTGSGPIGSRKL